MYQRLKNSYFPTAVILKPEQKNLFIINTSRFVEIKRLAITKDDISIKRDSIFVYESGVSLISTSANVTDS